MTTGIALVRENAASMEPPRSLWVTFPLGRPLGVPDDAAFQHRVVAAALALLSRSRGPILEDYPEDAPELSVESAAACPVSFATPQDMESWRGRLSSELKSLKPWYAMALKRRQGRTLVGAAKAPMEDIVQKLGDYLDAEELPTDELQWFKRAIEDAKAYYVEALTAQPGSYDQTEVYRTLWSETQLGAALREFYQAFERHPKLFPLARMVLPREAVGGATGEGTQQTEAAP